MLCFLTLALHKNRLAKLNSNVPDKGKQGTTVGKKHVPVHLEQLHKDCLITAWPRYYNRWQKRRCITSHFDHIFMKSSFFSECVYCSDL